MSGSCEIQKSRSHTQLQNEKRDGEESSSLDANRGVSEDSRIYGDFRFAESFTARNLTWGHSLVETLNNLSNKEAG